jgi:acyl-CoA thioesterase FadM
LAQFRFETRMPLRHTDTFGGTPFVHGGVLIALTEIALDRYDEAASIPSHRDVLRFQTRTEVQYLAALRWDDEAVVRLRCAEMRPGRLVFECEVAAGSNDRVIAQMTHRYAYVNTLSGAAEVPPDWQQIAAAVQQFDADVEVSE